MRTLLLVFLLIAPAAFGQGTPQPPAPPPQEDCGCGVPVNPRGPR